MGEKSLIEFKKISKDVNGVSLLKEIDFKVNRGEIVGLIGPNGSGKTTIMKVMSGLYRPTSGEVIFKGEKLNKGNISASIARSMGVFIEEPNFISHMNAKQNLIYHCRLYNLKKKELNVLLEDFDLIQSRKKSVSKFSLGMKQKLGIIRVLLHEPDLLILDEPTNGLDAEARFRFKKYIKEYVSRGKTVIISSHLLQDLQEICTDYIFIKNGEQIERPVIDENIFEVKIYTDKSIKTIINIEQESEISKNNICVYETLIKTSYNDLPKVSEKIVKSNINLYTISEIEKSLENIYINFTN